MRSISVLITGGSGDIGLALYHLLYEDPRFHCYLHFRNQESYERVKHTLFNDRTHIVFADLSDLNATEQIAKNLPPIDVLVNNAGHYEAGYFLDTPFEKIHQQLTTNYLAPLMLIHYVSSSMRACGKGKIINISSGSGNHGGLLPSFGYAASKNGLNFLPSVLGKELSLDNIAVVTVVLRFVETRMLASYKEYYEAINGKPLSVNISNTGVMLYKPRDIAQRIQTIIGDTENNSSFLLEIA